MLDALPFLGSSASVTLMKDLAIQGVVPDNTVREWVLAMSFIPRPDKSIMSSIYALLSHKSDDSAVVLGIAALTHTYCVQNGNCDQDESGENAHAIITFLEKRATYAYQQSNSSETVRCSFK